MTPSAFYWCLQHGRVETEEDRCKADDRLGPYPTVAGARNWRETVEDRNDAWKDADEAWEGEESDDW